MIGSKLGHSVITTVILALPAHAADAERAPNNEAMAIEGALLSAPEVMREAATVILEVPGQDRITLRNGKNDIICRANTLKAGFNTYCYPKALDKFWTRYEQLGAEGKSNIQIRDALTLAVKSGEIVMTPGLTTYTMSGDSQQSSLPLMAVFLPNATAQSTGLSDQRNHYRPWLM
jgi:hypothetical protein